MRSAFTLLVAIASFSFDLNAQTAGPIGGLNDPGQAAGPIITIPLEDPGANFGPVDPSAMLRLRITSSINNFSDESAIVFHTGIPALDPEDALKFIFTHPSAPQVATLATNGTPLAINAYGPHAAGFSIPIIVNAGITGTYTITFTEVGELNFSCPGVQDLTTGTIFPLTSLTTYNLTINANDDPQVPRLLLRTMAPVANFTSPASAVVNTAVAFTNTSVDAATYAWTFGDGGTSTFKNPSRTYTQTGTYTVNLAIANGSCTSNFSRTITVTPPPILLSAKLMLEGPYNAANGLMNDALRAGGLIPSIEPYTALGFAPANSGTSTSAPVLAVTGNNAIVDWVLVQLRDANDATSIIGSLVGLVQRDADVVATNGTSPLAFTHPVGSYFVVALHRNHLGVMSRTAIPLSTSTTALNFSMSSTPTHGSEPRKPISGAFPSEALWAGDVNTDGKIIYTGATNDRDIILQAIGGVIPTNTQNGYLGSDVNMDGTAKYTGGGNDRDFILQNIGGVVPTNTRVEQVP